jgi:excinuclease UvrABC ATPase subunit
MFVSVRKKKVWVYSDVHAMTQTITEEPEKAWDVKELAKALESTGYMIANAERYKKERDEYRDLQEQWETYAESLEREIQELKSTPYTETLEKKIRDMKSAVCKGCIQKGETNRRLLVALDKAKTKAKKKVPSRVTTDSRQVADDWAKSC